MTEHVDFTDRLAESRRETEREVLPLLRRVADALPESAVGLLLETSRLLHVALEELGAAEAELRARNEELFAARTELDAQAQRYRDLFEHAPLPYVVTDERGVMRQLNQPAALLLGRPVNALIDQPLSSCVQLAERGVFLDGLARVVSGHGAEEWPIRFDTRTGGAVEVRLLARAVPGPHADRPLVYWLLIPSFGGDADFL